MKKPKLLVFLVLFVVVAVVAASTFAVVAYMIRRSEQLQNEFIPASVECLVEENFQAEKKTSVTVQNTGNIEAYVRLRLVTYWQDSKGFVVGRSSPEVQFGNGWNYDTDKWIYDAKEKTLYYKLPVAAGQSTTDLLKLTNQFTGIHIEKVVENVNGIVYTYHPVVEFIAEAIQSQPKNAVSDKWHVTVGADGTITAVG